MEEEVVSVAPVADLILAVGGRACHLLAWAWTDKTNHLNHNLKAIMFFYFKFR